MSKSKNNRKKKVQKKPAARMSRGVAKNIDVDLGPMVELEDEDGNIRRVRRSQLTRRQKRGYLRDSLEEFGYDVAEGTRERREEYASEVKGNFRNNGRYAIQMLVFAAAVVAAVFAFFEVLIIAFKAISGDSVTDNFKILGILVLIAVACFGVKVFLDRINFSITAPDISLPERKGGKHSSSYRVKTRRRRDDDDLPEDEIPT